VARPAARKAGGKLAAVHYAARGGAACVPFERPGGRLVTAEPGDVTCGHCCKRPGWRAAVAAAGLDEHAGESLRVISGGAA